MPYGDNDSGRTLTISWEDPRRLAEVLPTMSGLEFMRTLIEGSLPPPPILVLVGMRLAKVQEGRTIFDCVPGEQHYNPLGVVHGGLIGTMCDSVMGCAVHSVLPAGVGYTTVELHVHLVRALTREIGEIRCEAHILYSGRRLTTAEAKVFDGQGKLYGHATTSCMMFPAGER